MKTLRDEILTFLTTQTAFLLERVYPGNHIPRFFAGIAIDDTAHMDVLHLLGLLRNLGVTELDGRPTEDLQLEILRRVKGEEITTFYSFRLSETLLGRGRWEDNPLLEPLTEAQRGEIFKAVDSTAMFERTEDGGSIGGYPNNYWGVLGRCEIGRQRLGILEDEHILKTCLQKLESLLFTNPLGFLDDAKEGFGRYDIYSFDIHLFIEPLFEHLDADRLRGNLENHTRVMERLIRENGASVCWGRSTGSLSILMAMEWMALTLERDLAQDRSRSLGLIAHAFRSIQAWFEQGLVKAHRNRSPFAYRGTHRYLQLGSDLLIKLAYVADVLGKCPDSDREIESDPDRLFPPQDFWQPFDDRSCGVWVYRDRNLSFQLPVVSAGGWGAADYTAFPAAPGVFECPVQESWPSGLPRVFFQSRQCLPTGLPDRSEHSAGRLSLHWSSFQIQEEGGGSLPADLDVTYTVKDGWIELEVTLDFPETVEAVSWQLPETRRPLQLECRSEPSSTYRRIPVGGIKEWRSFWSELEQLHQWECSNCKRLSYSLRFRPRFVVRELPGDHDYNRALFTSMDQGQMIHDPRSQGRPFNEMDAAEMTRGCDILHIGWPEHWFSSHNQDPETFHDALLGFVGQLKDQSAKIVWTMHNQRPHSWDPQRGRTLYEAMARVVDGVIHHSECGMNQMRDLLPFRPDALHTVIPHGHFGEEVQVAESRTELEARYGLSPCTVRWGVFGRPQSNKQIELILEAFLASEREDIQLITDAQPSDWQPSEDPRLILLPREGWLMREEIARRAHLADAMVAAHLPADYLTTGVFADAVGMGVPMLAPKWAFLEEMLGDSAFYHDNTRASLTEWFNRLTIEDVRIGQERTLPLQARYAWPRLAELTLDLYRDLGVTRGWV